VANLHRLESNEPETGGILFDFGNGLTKAAQWRSAVPVDGTLELAKRCTAQVVQALIEGNHHDAVRNTNWASAVAGCQKHVSDWNEALRAAIGQAVDKIPLQH
jgi:hypothetical protein